MGRSNFVVGGVGMGLSCELGSIGTTRGSGAVGGFAVRFDFVAGVHAISTGVGAGFEEDEPAGSGGFVRWFAQHGDA